MNSNSASECRSCGNQIVWLKTAKGKNMPVDADTVEVGDQQFDHSRHISHFSSCPNAEQHRKQQGRGYTKPDVITQQPVPSTYVRAIPEDEERRINEAINRARG